MNKATEQVDSPPTRTRKNQQALDKLSPVFRRYGYDATSVAMLQDATGMSKGSLYHRFPGGKVQMVQEIIATRGEWLRTHVFAPLRDDRPPGIRVQDMLRFAERHYENGLASCLLGMLALSESASAYGEGLRAVFSEWIESLATPLIDAGMSRADALRLSELSVMKIQGALLLTRALKTNRPFINALDSIRAELLAAIADASSITP